MLTEKVNARNDVFFSLFGSVDSRLLAKPTYASLTALYKYYDSRTGHADTIGPEQKRAVQTFLDAVVKTRPIEALREFLADKGWPKFM